MTNKLANNYFYFLSSLLSLLFNIYYATIYAVNLEGI